MGKPVQIDSDQLAVFQASQKMLEQLYADPDAGMDFKKMIKKKFPSAQMPELEAMSATEKMLKPLNERLDAFEKERTKEKEDRQVADLQERFDRISKERGLTEEGQKRLLGVMKDRGISNPEDAIVIFEKDLPKAKKDSKPYSSRMNFISREGEKDPEHDKLMNDPDAYMTDAMMDFVEGIGKDKE